MSTFTPTGQRVLIVDDNPSVASLLSHALRAEGCLVDVADDGPEALASIATHPPDLIVLDLELPSLPGDVICRRLKNDPATNLIPIVMVTGQADFECKLDAWEYGADDFLTKPLRVAEVTSRCRSLLRIKRLVEERDSAESVVFALARTVEAKSPYTHGHSERVMRYALELADAQGVTAHDREVLRKGALLHDIGKISVPDAILDKPGKLTAAEFEIVKGHAAQGAHIVEPLHALRETLPLIRSHHERLDGKGYPDGLHGEQITPLIRILSVADVYDALSSERPYRQSIPHQRCLEMLRENAQSGGLDAELVTLFSAIVTPLPTRVAAGVPSHSLVLTS
ncbi:MAG TPA: HD domain-containing phosphohydrolase [Gemmataceae bacterium]|nr:HD domain-containing phosphohydrolase [Gemmataceae bacterium]